MPAFIKSYTESEDFSRVFGAAAGSEPVFGTESLSTPSDLLKARTIGEVYQLPFSLTIAPLTRPHLLSGFYDEAPKQTRVVSTMYHTGKWTIEREHIPKAASFGEASRIVTAHQNWLLESCRAGGVSWSGWKSDIVWFMSGRAEHGKFLHPDAPGNPLALVYLAATHVAPLVVPHKETDRILKNSELAHALDLRIDRKEDLRAWIEITKDLFGTGGAPAAGVWPSSVKKRRLMTVYEEILEEFGKALRPTATGAVNCMTGITIHTQSGNLPRDRTCFRSITHFTR